MRKGLKILVGIMILGAVALVSFKGTPAYAQDDQRSVTIQTLKGNVEIKKPDGDWVKAQEGIILHEQDEIRTQADGYAKLMIDDGKTGDLEVSKYTRMRINTLLGKEDGPEKTTLLDVAIGRVMIHVQKLQGHSKFEVTTPTATMGVRGTAFEVIVSEKDGKIKEK